MGKWEMVRLGEIVDVHNGFAFKSDNYCDDGIRIIRITNVQKGFVEDLQPQFYSADEVNKKYALFENDLLISLTGNVGRVAVLPKKYLPAALNQRVACLRVKDESYVDRMYIFSILNSNIFENDCIVSAKGVAQKNMSTEWLKQYQIPLPPLDEQKRIAKNLDLASEIVKGYKEQLADLDNLVQSVFYEMFGNPVKNEKELPQVMLCECLDGIENGKSMVCNNTPSNGNDPAILKLSAVTYGFYCEGENKAMIKASDFIESTEIRKGDLLFTRKNTPELVGMSAYVYSTAPKLMMPDLIFRLNTNGLCNKIFLWKLINHDLFRCKIMSLASGSAKSMSNISKARLGQLLVPLPSIELQTRFAAIVTQIEAQKTQVQKALIEAENLFNSLMQEYFE